MARSEKLTIKETLNHFDPIGLSPDKVSAINFDCPMHQHSCANAVSQVDGSARARLRGAFQTV